MATITITLPDAHANRVMNALAAHYSWSASVPNPAFNTQKAEDPVTNPKTVPNPETRAAHAKRRMIEWLVAMTKDHERRAAQLAVAEPNDITAT